MAAVPSGDVTLTRGTNARITPIRVFIPELVVTSTALVNAPSGITYPTGDIPIDTTSVGFEGRLGQMVRIKAPSTGVIKYEGGLRAPATTSNLPIDGIQSGDTGLAYFTAQTIANNDEVEIYNVFRPSQQWSRIDPITDELLKMWDLSYTNQTSTPDPQVNITPAHHQAADVDPVTGVASFTLSASTSVSWTGNAVTYAWTLPAGVTLQGGYTLTDATIEVDADPGQYLIRVRVTDSVTTESKLSEGWLFARDNSTYRAFSDLYNLVEIRNDESTRSSWSCTLVIEEDTDGLPTRDNYLYTGALVLMTYAWEFSTDGGASFSRLSADSERVFIGFVQSFDEIESTVDGRARMAINVQGTMAYLSNLGIAIQGLIEASSPARWTEVSTSLNDAAFFAWYLFNFHARTPSRLTNFYNNDGFDLFHRETFSTAQGTIADAMRNAAAYIPGANVGSAANGDIHLQRHMSLEGSSYRSGKTNRFTFTTQDIVVDDEGAAVVRYSLNQLKQASDVEAGALVYAPLGASVPYRIRSNYLAPSPGVSLERMRDFIAISEADAQARVGNYAAYVNRPVKDFTIEIRHDLIEPALMEPVLMSASSADPFETGLLAQQALPIRVTREWDLDAVGAPPRVLLTVEPVTSGSPGQTVPDRIPGQAWVGGTWCYEFGTGALSFADYWINKAYPAANINAIGTITATQMEGVRDGVSQNIELGTELDLGIGCTVTQISYDMEWWRTTGTTQYGMTLFVNSVDQGANGQQIIVTTVSPTSGTITTTSQVSGRYIGLGGGTTTFSGGAFIRITRVRINGYGPKPTTLSAAAECSS